MTERFSDIGIQYDMVVIATAVGAEAAPREHLPTATGEPAVAIVAMGMFNACAREGHRHGPERVQFAVNVETGAALLAYVQLAFERAGIDPATLNAAVDQKRAAIRAQDGFAR